MTSTDHRGWDGLRIGDMLGDQAAANHDRELFCFEDHRISYGGFQAWVEQVAADLVDNGVRRRDRVMVQLPNCLEALVFQMAAFRVGAINVPVVPIYREHEVRQILADCRPVAIAVGGVRSDREPAAEIDALLGDLGYMPKIRYLVGGHRDGWSEAPAMAPGPARADGAADRRGTALPEPLDAEEPALLLYTSGTTSAPKGVLLTSRALIAHMRNFQTALRAGPDSVILAATPLSHLGGFVAGVVFPAFLGARSVVLPEWRPDDAVDVIERERATIAMGATVFLSDLVERYEAGAGPRHRLNLYACAGATIPASIITRAQAVGVEAMRCYGMTETAGVCAAAPKDAPLHRRAEWDGRVLLDMRIEAVDLDRRALPAGEEGELRIRGPQLLSGYTDPDLSAAQIDDAGWFYPGDVGIVDDEGWVRMTGRLKDIVNRGGEKFSTLDIEAALGSHPDVVAVAVTAIPDDRFGEGVGAWLVLRDGASWNGPQRLVEHLETVRLTRQKIPTYWEIVDRLPGTASGKIRKQELHVGPKGVRFDRRTR